MMYYLLDEDCVSSVGYVHEHSAVERNHHEHSLTEDLKESTVRSRE